MKCDQKVGYRTIKSSVVRISLLYLLNFPHCPKEKRLFLDCVPGQCAIQVRTPFGPSVGKFKR